MINLSFRLRARAHACKFVHLTTTDFFIKSGATDRRDFSVFRFDSTGHGKHTVAGFPNRCLPFLPVFATPTSVCHIAILFFPFFFSPPVKLSMLVSRPDFNWFRATDRRSVLTRADLLSSRDPFAVSCLLENFLKESRGYCVFQLRIEFLSHHSWENRFSPFSSSFFFFFLFQRDSINHRRL